MSARTEPDKRKNKNGSGNFYQPSTPAGILLIAGLVFMLAWMMWTFVFAGLLPR